MKNLNPRSHRLARLSALAVLAVCAASPAADAMSSAYFQTNDLNLGYRDGKGLARQFKQVRVNTYASEIESYVQEHTHLTMGLVKFSGLSPNKLDFTYITPPMKTACHFAGDLLSRTVSNTTGNNADKGNSNAKNYLCAFDKLLTAEVSGSTPLFSIVDHNSAHNVSSPLAARAFHAAGSDSTRMRILINFDNHSDYAPWDSAKVATPEIRCDNWATFITKPIPQSTWTLGGKTGTSPAIAGHEHGVADYFIHIGPDALAGSGHFNGTRFARSGGALQSVPGTPSDVVAQLQYIVALEKKDIDVYISVDRDFMIGSYTPWGDGPHTMADGRKAVLDALTFFKSHLPTDMPGPSGERKRVARLVGFDIVGLPAHPGSKPPKTPMTEDEAILQANEDIAQFYRAVHDY